jgi:phosphoribosylglycinamide formyltransferase-1
LDAQRQAWEHGVKIAGCTVHLVDEQLDHGPIVLQATVPVHDGDSPEMLSSRILEQEHATYPKALALLVSGSLHIEGRRVTIRR